MLLALKAGNKDLVTVLIENGADINAPSVDVRIFLLCDKVIVIPPELSICFRILDYYYISIDRYVVFHW